MTLKNGIFTLIKCFSLSVFLILLVSIATYAGDEGKKSMQSSAVAKTNPAEWKKVEEAAKREGKLVMYGPPGAEWRKPLADLFQQEYPEIIVEYSAGAGRNLWPRVRQERELGKKLWDLRIGGLDPPSFDAKRDGFLAPISPLLLPETADSSKWIGGADHLWIDKEKKYLLGFNIYMTPSAFVNRDFIKESDLRSTEQLLDPKFRGKIVILTPTGGTSRKSLFHLGFLYGENFIRELLSKQDVVITDDSRQQVEWLVRGRCPIIIGFDSTLLIPFIKQGLGKNIKPLEEKIIRTSAGSGVLSLLEGAPHPNAAKLYVNWLLSQKTQTIIAKSIGHNSRRIDVPPVEAAVDLARLSKYRDSSTEEAVEFEMRYEPAIKESLKK